MHQIDIKQIDLNLLSILKVLLDESNVTRASEKLNLTQSATSHALQRLRKMFNDPLLERSASGMRPTPRAIALQASLENILLDIKKLVEEPIFVPEFAQGKIHIASSDYGTTVILPSVIKQIALSSPCIDIECYGSHTDILEKLKDGKLDLGLGVFDLDGTKGFKTQNLFAERFVSIVRSDHPILKKEITLKSYIAYPHALITTTGSPLPKTNKLFKSHVDRKLEELGVKRRVILKLPHFLSAALIVGQTDLVLTIPRRIALLFESFANVTIFEPPIDLGEYNYMQVWAERSNNSPFHIWLRNLVYSQSQDI